MEKGIHNFILSRDSRGRRKAETVWLLGALHPLLIPNHIWMDISMDLIVAIPKERNKIVIMVLVYCLKKQSHLYALPLNFTSSPMA
jgi:hypothetical protein